MADRAEKIVKLLFRFVEESRPLRKALDTPAPSATPGPSSGPTPAVAAPALTITRSATPADMSKKKRKTKENANTLEVPDVNADADEENVNPNPDPDQDEEEEEKAGGEWGMSKEHRMRMFGNNEEAYELAEKDMRTITAKRTASQGGVLPQQKTKYKKRSVSSLLEMQGRRWSLILLI